MRKLPLILIAICTVAATALPLASPASAGARPTLPVPRFVPTTCPTEPVATTLPKDARCGFLVVPENRAEPGGPTIDLTVGIVPAVSAHPAPDPVVYLAGGPGGFPLGEAQSLIAAGFNRDRELILLSQRGTLYGPPNPAPVCPEADKAFIATLGLPLDGSAAIALNVAAARGCYQRLVAAGADLGAYNTTENAADVADLRVALGIREWDVFGTSYGTNLAMTYMREYPQGIRSVTLDSVEPPEVVAANLFAPNAREGFDSLFQACAEQPQCGPGIERTFTDLVRRLEAHPVTTRVEPPAGGAAVKLVLDGGRLVNWLIEESFNTADYRNVPAMIAKLAHGDPGPIATEVAARVIGSGVGIIGAGLALGVGCAEWIPYMTGTILSAGRLAFPAYPDSVLAPALHVTYLPQQCGVWNVPVAPAALRAATPSTIPTLMLAGTFDAVTPVSWEQIAARTLTNSTVLQFTGIGHTVTLSSPCGQQVFASFLATPNAPDTACVAKLRPPTFVPAPTPGPK